MQIFNFRDGHVTTFRHPSGAYICQMPGHSLSSLAKAHFQSLGFPSVPLVLGNSQMVLYKREKCCFGIWLRLRYKNSGILHDSTRPHLHSDGLPPKSRRSVVSI